MQASTALVSFRAVYHRRGAVVAAAALAAIFVGAAASADDGQYAKEKLLPIQRHFEAAPAPQDGVATLVRIWAEQKGVSVDSPEARAFADSLARLDREPPANPNPPPARERSNYAPNATPADIWVALTAGIVEMKKSEEPTDDAQQARQVKALRDSAHKLDGLAGELEELDLFNRADRLRFEAQQLRFYARALPIGKYEREEAQESSLAYNLHTLRAQLQLYQSEHDGKYPTIQPGAEGQPSLPQLYSATDDEGKIGSDTAHRFGPYMVGNLPRNPFDDSTYVEEVKDWPPQKATENGGWLYHPATGQIVPNTPGRLND